MGDAIPLTGASDVCRYLERYIPEVLEREHPEWSGEGLDAVDVARAVKVGDHELSLLGTVILLGDQTAAPLLLNARVSSNGDRVVDYVVRLGEPGGGPLGISGPPCRSGAASRLLYRLADRLELDRVSWVYRVGGNREGSD